ncbi:MAG: ATP-binding cassette domain-containing protein [Planctomycetes bacterium]|nr:ATP-binding cassette domain-containing protein [Planctomycetota bacterium]
MARTRAALSADTPGRIVELNVTEGSVVKKGDVVARLYADEYRAALEHAQAGVTLAQSTLERVKLEVGTAEGEIAHSKSAEKSAQADLDQANSNLATAETQYKRAEELVKQGVYTAEQRDLAKRDLDDARSRVPWAQANLDTAHAATAQSDQRLLVARAAVTEAQNQIAVAEATRDQAQATLDKTEVKAPFDGIVVLKDAEVGEVVSPNGQGGSTARGSVVTMVDFGSLEVQAEVPETTLPNVKLGAPAKIWLDAYPDKAYAGRVDRIWPTANRSKATVEVRIVFEERDDRLRPEMGVRMDAGGYFALMGPSGSGKTTLLNLIGGLDRADSGVIEVAGEDLTQLSGGELAHWRATSVGFVFQGFNLIPVLTALENVELPLKLSGLSGAKRREHALYALELVGLADRAKHRPRQLSGGQEQRVAIARAIVSDPTLILADEPTGDLDRASADQVLDLLGKLNQDLKKTILMVTHDPHAAERATTIVHLDKGQLGSIEHNPPAAAKG